jgi:hypothetical protein
MFNDTTNEAGAAQRRADVIGYGLHPQGDQSIKSVCPGCFPRPAADRFEALYGSDSYGEITRWTVDDEDVPCDGCGAWIFACITLDITEPGRGIGWVRSAPESEDWSIYASRTDEGRTWQVWSDDHGSSTASTLTVAVKRWARAYGIEHGAAIGEYEHTGAPLRITW